MIKTKIVGTEFLGYVEARRENKTSLQVAEDKLNQFIGEYDEQCKYALIDIPFTDYHALNVQGYRLIALRDFGDVKKFDLGGVVCSADNLSHKGDCWVYTGCSVFSGSVEDNATVMGQVIVTGAGHIKGNAVIDGNGTLGGHYLISDNAMISGVFTLRGDMTLSGNAHISGITTGNIIVMDDNSELISAENSKTLIGFDLRLHNESYVNLSGDYFKKNALNSPFRKLRNKIFSK